MRKRFYSGKPLLLPINEHPEPDVEPEYHQEIQEDFGRVEASTEQTLLAAVRSVYDEGCGALRYRHAILGELPEVIVLPVRALQLKDHLPRLPVFHHVFRVLAHPATGIRDLDPAFWGDVA